MTLEQAALFIRQRTHFILTTHETPDGDGLGSECALLNVLRQLGKTAYVFNSDPIPEKYKFLDPENQMQTLDSDDILPGNLSAFTLIILDTNDINNIGEVRDLVLKRTAGHLIIDHHQYGADDFNSYIVDDASSTSEILFDLFSELGTPFNYEAAIGLYVGIVYDTGSFIYPKTTAKTFHIAYELVKKGVHPNFVYQKIYESNSISSLVLQSKVLSSLELVFNEHIAIQTMLKQTVLECGASYEESDTLINIPLKSQDVLVSIFFKENLEGILRCSLRSKGNINVAEIAQTFGGGGHKTAAGFKCRESLQITRDKVLNMLQKYFT